MLLRGNWSAILATAILLAIFVFQIFVSRLPVESLLEHAVLDDAFYYLEVAHRASMGEGFTFDGQHQTNGFQPAWELLLVGLATISRNRETLLRSALLLASFLNLASGLVIYTISTKILKGGFSFIPLLVWSSIQFNPHLSLAGMETSLNWLVFSSTLGYLLKVSIHRNKNTPQFASLSARHVIAMGVLCALLFLSRIDNLVYIIAVLILASDVLCPERSNADSVSGKLLARAKTGFAIGLVAGFLVSPYLAWNVMNFGILLPISALVKQKVNFISVIAPLGGYLSLQTLAHSLQRILDKLLWALAYNLSVLGFGYPFWLAKPILIAMLSFAILISFTSGYLIKNTRLWPFRNNRRASLASLPRIILSKSFLVLVPFWASYGLAGRLFEGDLERRLAKGTLIAIGLLGAFVFGTRSGAITRLSAGPRVDLGTTKIFRFLLGAMLVHAAVLVCTGDYYLDFTSWYFANWFVVISLLSGILIAYLSRNLEAQLQHNLFVSVFFIWAATGWISTGYKSVNMVMAEPQTPPIWNKGAWATARWIDSNLPPDSILASYYSGIVGYFSNRATINLDGWINNEELLPYLFGPYTMTDYIATVCPDYLVHVFDGTYLPGELPSGNSIWGIERSRLEPVKCLHSQDYLNAPLTFIVFRIEPPSSCPD